MVKVISEADYGQVQECPLAVLDFSATWCGPCKMIAPILEKLSEEMKGKVGFFKTDVDASPGLAARFGIQNIPTLVILKNGEEAGREMGFKPEPLLRSILEGYLN